MFRLLGFLGGTTMFLVLAIQELPGFIYYYICSTFCLFIIFAVIIFRILAKYLNGFWRVWSKRLDRWVTNAVFCFSQCMEMPDYQLTINPDLDQNQNKELPTHFWWGLLEMLIAFLLTAFAPFLLIFLIFCFCEAVYRECEYKNERKSYKERREEEVARQSARMSLEIPLNRSTSGELHRQSSLKSAIPVMVIAPADESTRQQFEQRRSSKVPTVRILEEIPEDKEIEQESNMEAVENVKSSKHSLPPQQNTFYESNEQSNPPPDDEEDFTQKIIRNPSKMPRHLLPLSISKITEESKSYVQSGDYSHFQTIKTPKSNLPRQSAIDIDYPEEQEEDEGTRQSLPRFKSQSQGFKRQRAKDISPQNDDL